MYPTVITRLHAIFRTLVSDSDILDPTKPRLDQPGTYSFSRLFNPFWHEYNISLPEPENRLPDQRPTCPYPELVLGPGVKGPDISTSEELGEREIILLGRDFFLRIQP